MSAQFKPGDVAMVTVDYGKGPSEIVCFRTPGWWRDSKTGGAYGSALREVKDARPLIVIDPESVDDAERLVRLFWANGTDDCDDMAAMRAALREFANPTPPKPDEPTGLGAVVRDAGTRWTLAVRIPGSFPWVGEHGGVRGWNEFSDAVEVLSEGVS